MKLSQHLKDEKAFIEAMLGDDVICSDCGATLKTYGECCVADLGELCPGFEHIEDAKDEFSKKRKLSIGGKF